MPHLEQTPAENRCPASKIFTRPVGRGGRPMPAAVPERARCALTAGHGGLHLAVSPVTELPVKFADEPRPVIAIREHLEATA